MRRIAVFGLAALLFLPVAWSAAAPAKHWQEVRSDADGFAALFPGKPTLSAEPVPNSHGAVQRTWRLDVSNHETYQLAVTIFHGYTFPPPTPDLYDHLLAGYAASSRTHLRNRRMIDIVGHPAVEAIFDTDHDFHHLVDVLVVGDHLYVIASGGRGAHEQDADALKFGRSFRLLEP